MILFACIFLKSKMNCKFFIDESATILFAYLLLMSKNELQVLLINLQCFYLLAAPTHQQQPIADHFSLLG